MFGAFKKIPIDRLGLDGINKLGKSFKGYGMKKLIIGIWITCIACSSFGSSWIRLTSDVISSNNLLNVKENPETSSELGEDFDKWQVSVEQGHLLIPVGEILTPINYGVRELSANHPQHGSITIEGGELASAVHVPIASAQPRSSNGSNTPVVYDRRPTLFVSIPGWHGSLDGRHSEIDNWQSEDLQEAIKGMTKHASDHFSEIRHMAVQWQSARPNGKQVNEANKAIKSWLADRSYKWDVVIIGHSRGGVFAHELASDLAGYHKVDSLHTVLLDPTAAKGWGDIYPRKLPTSSNVASYGSVHYDGDGFIDDDDYDVSIYTSTDSDEPISGYNNYGRNNTKVQFDHSTYASRWVQASQDSGWGFELFLDDLWSIKDAGTFNQDGDTVNYSILDVGISKDVYAYLDSSYEDGNVYVQGELVIGPTAATINMQVGEDGVAVSNSVGVGIAYVSQTTVVTTTRAEVAMSSGAASMEASISLDEGLQSSHDVLGIAQLDAGIGIDGGVDLNITVFGTEIDLSPSGIADGAGSVVNKITSGLRI